MGEVKVVSLFKAIKKGVVEKQRFFPIRTRVLSKFKKRTLRKVAVDNTTGITLVLGELKNINKTGIQSVVFDLTSWKKNEAKRWFKNNKEKITFLLDKNKFNMVAD